MVSMACLVERFGTCLLFWVELYLDQLVSFLRCWLPFPLADRTLCLLCQQRMSTRHFYRFHRAVRSHHGFEFHVTSKVKRVSDGGILGYYTVEDSASRSGVLLGANRNRNQTEHQNDEQCNQEKTPH